MIIQLVVVVFFGIIQVIKSLDGWGRYAHFRVNPGVIGLSRLMFDVTREKITVHNAFRYISCFTSITFNRLK